MILTLKEKELIFFKSKLIISFNIGTSTVKHTYLKYVICFISVVLKIYIAGQTFSLLNANISVPIKYQFPSFLF